MTTEPQLCLPPQEKGRQDQEYREVEVPWSTHNLCQASLVFTKPSLPVIMSIKLERAGPRATVVSVGMP